MASFCVLSVNEALLHRAAVAASPEKGDIHGCHICRLFGLYAVVAVAVLIYSLSVACAEGADGPGNVAVGKPYTLTPAPNYALCADAGDKTQLTDGLYSEGYFWTQKGTVGWTADTMRFVTITIDLGSVMPISGLSYNTAAGVADVTWPSHIYALTSDDGKTFFYAGDLVDLDAEHGKPLPDGYSLHRYWTDKLGTRGRFVKIVVPADGPYIFVDEIEVYRGAEALVRQPLTGRKIVDSDGYIVELLVQGRVWQRLKNDLAAVRDQTKGLAGSEQMESELAAIEKAIPDLQVAVSDDFRTVFPLNDLHRRIFAVQAAIWRSSISNSIVVWQKHRWDMLSPTEPPRPGKAKVAVAMMRNEFRGAAFNISSCGKAPAVIQLSIDGLPGGSNPKYITVHDAPFTDTKTGVPVVAALPVARNDGRSHLISVEPGMTKQVWLTFNSKGLPPGEYNGSIALVPGSLKIPISLKIYPFNFPDRPTLHLCGWDYTDMDKIFDLTEQNRSPLIQHLRERFVDTPWATSGTMSSGQYDKDGNMTEPPDAGNFKKWIERWPAAQNYFVFVNAQSSFAGLEMGTPPFKSALSNWITWWVKKMSEWRIKPEQLGLLLVDEPSTPAQDKTIVEYARIIKKAQPKVVIWEDVTWTDPTKADPELFGVSDTLCPNMPMWIEQGQMFADFYIKQRNAGKELWFYSCSAPGKLLDPYAYHLMQQWFCWKYDAKGSGFWAFADSSGASSWNEYMSVTGAYTPVFLGKNTVTAGKHMEAIREGIEDYEYLRMLRDRVAELEKKNVKNDAVTAAKVILAGAADRVVGCMTQRKMINWQEPKDRSIADQVRLDVLEALMKLREL